MKTTITRTLAAAGLVACIAGASAREAGMGNTNRLDPAVAAEQLGCAVGLFEAAPARQSENLFFSPLSIATAFAMARVGARGATAAEMDRVFDFPADDAARDAFFGAVADLLNSESPHYQLVLANALWAQRGARFLPEFTGVLERRYNAPLRPLDFMAAAERSRRTINAWVEEQTRDRIRDLIPQGGVNEATRMVLTNAVYFKGTWLSTFRERLTRDEPFHLLSGGQSTVPLMRQTCHTSYAADDELQVLEMVYKGGDLSMVVLLPRARDGLPALERSLSAEMLEDWLGRLRGERVRILLPRFRVEMGFGLTEMLATMGMRCAFDPNAADFSGITGDRSLFVSAAVHKAFVDVNEVGTEAAAATGIMMEVTAMPAGPPPEFRADHPFLFLIRERRSGLVLFMGRFTTP